MAVMWLLRSGSHSCPHTMIREGLVGPGASRRRRVAEPCCTLTWLAIETTRKSQIVPKWKEELSNINDAMRGMTLETSTAHLCWRVSRVARRAPYPCCSSRAELERRGGTQATESRCMAGLQLCCCLSHPPPPSRFFSCTAMSGCTAVFVRAARTVYSTSTTKCAYPVFRGPQAGGSSA